MIDEKKLPKEAYDEPDDIVYVDGNDEVTSGLDGTEKVQEFEVEVD